MPSQTDTFPISAAGTFGAFLMGPARGRPWSLLAAAALHLAAATAAIGMAAWKVEELAPDKKVIITFNPVTIPAPPALPAPAPVKVVDRQQAPPIKRSAQPRPSNRPSAIVPSDPSEPTVAPIGGISPKSDVEGPCPPGASCAGPAAAPPRMLPPQVGEKRCLSCPLPRLPEAYRRLGTIVAVLARICADASGRTTKVDILRGIDGNVDRQIAGVLATWRFAPLSLDGRPVPFCYVSRFVFSSE